jgi:DNA helicase-2/ATP-dependent DNA helicase PcrA
VLAWPQVTGAGDQTQQKPSQFYEEARAAVGAAEEDVREELLGIDEDLFAAFRMMRDDVMGNVAQAAARLGEMRLDAHLDTAAAVARYMELLKLASLMERHPRHDELPAAIAEINSLLTQTASPEQRQLFLESNLDEMLLGQESERLRRRRIVDERAESSLEAYLPIRAGGLVLSATDIEIYRACPLRYKFARVYSVPKEQTLQQRFGILVHQVLERYHSQLANQEALAAGDIREPTADSLMSLFEAGWRRLGFSESNEERQLHEKAVAALQRYHERFASDTASPVWFERNFSFRIGPHLLRGRVDRVDRLPDGSYELIDYKTGRARTQSQLKDDIQLSLYQIGARESWRLESSRQSYYYVLDDEKVPLEPSQEDVIRIQETATDVATAILAQEFEPTPSYSACSICDFQLICPAAER